MSPINAGLGHASNSNTGLVTLMRDLVLQDSDLRVTKVWDSDLGFKTVWN